MSVTFIIVRVQYSRDTLRRFIYYELFGIQLYSNHISQNNYHHGITDMNTLVLDYRAQITP
jgi:hypothetical protein